MNTVFLGHNYIFLPELGSTNDFAQGLLGQHPPEGTVVRTGHQTAGRGQKGRSWLAEPGKGLTMSLILYPVFLLANRAFDLSRITALALQKTVKSWLPAAKVEIKWPNDILVNGKKIAGILIENHLEGAFMKSSVIGIGLNVNQSSFPDELKQKATSLFVESGTEHNIDEVMNKMLETFEPFYLLLRTGNIQSIERAYLQNLRGYQEKILVNIGGEPKELLLVGVDAQGRLALDMDGKLRFFDVKEAEVVF